MRRVIEMAVLLFVGFILLKYHPLLGKVVAKISIPYISGIIPLMYGAAVYIAAMAVFALLLWKLTEGDRANSRQKCEEEETND